MVRSGVILGVAVAVVCVSCTLAAFGIGMVLDDDGGYPGYAVLGTDADGGPVTGTASCRDIGESEREAVLEFRYSLETSGGTLELTSHLIMDGSEPTGGAVMVGTSETLGRGVTLWENGGFTYHVDGDGTVVAVDISAEGISARAVLDQ